MAPKAISTDLTLRSTAIDVVTRAAQGDAEAFDVIARRVGDALYRRALAILREEADARDATQETLVRAWRELPRLGATARFDAWLDRILVNVCRDELRRRGRRQLREVRPAEQGQDGATEGATDRRAGDDRRAAIEWAFGQLSIEDRTLIVLHHLETRSIADIAAVLAVPTGTVMRRLHTARGRLQAALERDAR